MDKGNVLVIGNSGVGKSTLINAILGDVAAVGWGTSGTTKELALYENDEAPFRIIDTIGFEPSYLKEAKAVYAVKKWSKESAKDVEGNKEIDIIWFCVEGTSSKLFDKTIKTLAKATSFWKSVPIVVVITKSYSEIEREHNVAMVHKALEGNKKLYSRVKAIVPIVAEIYKISDEVYVEQIGVNELIDITLESMPEGIDTAKYDIAKYKLNRKRVYAQGYVIVSTGVGAAIGLGEKFIPKSVKGKAANVSKKIPKSVKGLADVSVNGANLLGKSSILEQAEKRAIIQIAKVYDFDVNDEDVITCIDEIMSLTNLTSFVTDAISITGCNNTLGAIVYGAILFLITEASNIIFEQIYLGKKTFEDVEWIKDVIDEKLQDNEFVEKAKEAANELGDEDNIKEITQAINNAFSKVSNKVKSPNVKKSAAKKPAEKKPAAKKPAEKKPAAKKPAEKKPAAKKPAEKKPAAKKPV